jgi:hypothetical protein
MELDDEKEQQMQENLFIWRTLKWKKSNSYISNPPLWLQHKFILFLEMLKFSKNIFSKRNWFFFFFFLGGGGG